MITSLLRQTPAKSSSTCLTKLPVQIPSSTASSNRSLSASALSFQSGHSVMHAVSAPGNTLLGPEQKMTDQSRSYTSLSKAAFIASQSRQEARPFSKRTLLSAKQSASLGAKPSHSSDMSGATAAEAEEGEAMIASSKQVLEVSPTEVRPTATPIVPSTKSLLQAWHVNSPEQASAAAKALSDTLASVENAGEQVPISTEVSEHIAEQLKSLAAQNLMLFFQASDAAIHVAAYTMPDNTEASYLGTRAISDEAGSDKAVELTLSLTQERTLKHQIAARTKLQHQSKMSETLSKSALQLALQSSAKLMSKVPPNLVIAHPVLNASHQAFSLARFKSTFAKNFLNTSWGGGTALQLSSGEGFDYASLYQFVAEVIAAGNPENRPIYFTPDFDAKKVQNAEGKKVSPYEIAKSLIPSAHIIGDKIIGKSTFVVSSVIGTLEASLNYLQLPNPKRAPITIIGCEGNIGSGVLDHLIRAGFSNVAVSDRALTADEQTRLTKAGVQVLPAPRDDLHPGQFRQGINLIAYSNKAVPYGLASCSAQTLPEDSIILTASNNMLPSLNATAHYADTLAEKNTVFLPGTLLTTGGQYTAVADSVLSQLSEKPEFAWLLDSSAEHYALPVKDALRALNHAMLYAQTEDALRFVTTIDSNVCRMGSVKSVARVDQKPENFGDADQRVIDLEKIRERLSSCDV